MGGALPVGRAKDVDREGVAAVQVPHVQLVRLSEGVPQNPAVSGAVQLAGAVALGPDACWLLQRNDTFPARARRRGCKASV